MARNVSRNNRAASVTAGDLEELIRPRSGLCVSLYLPLERTGREVHQVPIRWKNLRGQVVDQLRKRGMGERESENFLEPMDSLFQGAPISQYQGEGLALFLGEGILRTFQLPVRFREFAAVGKRFQVKPLLPLLFENRTIHLLALSLHNTRLFRMDRQHLEEMRMEGVATNIEEALKYDDPEAYLQFYTGTPSPGPGRLRPAIFFGQGGGLDGREAKEAVARFLQQVDRGVQKALNGRTEPLMLAGQDHLLGIYRSVNSYRGLLEEAVDTNPEDLGPEGLQGQAWEKLAPRLEEERRRTLERYSGKLSEGEAGNSLISVVPAAAYGRVEYLFLPEGSIRWGAFDPDSGKVDIHAEENPESVDLLDLAAAQTLMHQGIVHLLPPESMPDGADIAATFRY